MRFAEKIVNRLNAQKKMPALRRLSKSGIHILENHRPMPLIPGAAESMQDIVQEFEKELKCA